jgi:arylsulfatase A-like enzyme
VIVSDHGEMLGEHNIMGHGLGVYQQLVHVPLMIRFPGQKRGRRVDQRVSTRSLFHTVLAAAGVETVTGERVGTVQTGDHNLERIANPERVYSEAYPPDNMTSIMEKQAPALLDAFAAKANRWAVYNHVYKLIRVEDVRDDLFNLDSDPGEMKPLDNEAEELEKLGRELDAFLADCRARRPEALTSANVDLEDEQIAERLRGLGYLE